MAGAERVELPLTVLETVVLPLNEAPINVSLQFNFGFSHLSAPLLSTWAFGSSAN